MHALNFGLCGETYPTVSDALKAAVCDADSNDFIFVGGSSFVVADLLSEGHYKLNELWTTAMIFEGKGVGHKDSD